MSPLMSPLGSPIGSTTGFFGKLPARGDFVRAGLTRGFIEPWDSWLRQVMPASRGILGETWTAAWLEAPVWRFALPPGLCGPDAALGLWMPSVDRIGQYFPLTLARIEGSGAVDPRFLSIVEAAGCAAIAEDWAPEALAARLAIEGEADGIPPAMGTWWTGGSPRRSAWTFTCPNLPDEMTFTRMLDARAGGSGS